MMQVSTKAGAAVAAFPDVCKTPTPGGPVPLPYPNIVNTGQPQPTAKVVGASKTPLTKSLGDLPGMAPKFALGPVVGQQLRSQLQMLHGQLMAMPGGNPNRWHELLDQYVVLTAEVYKTLTNR